MTRCAGSSSSSAMPRLDARRRRPCRPRSAAGSASNTRAETGCSRSSPRLIVGARMGERRRCRRDADIALELDEPAHLVTGLLADGLDGVDESVDVHRPANATCFFLAFPAARRPRPPLPLLPGRAARPLRRARRAPSRFLAACALECLGPMPNDGPRPRSQAPARPSRPAHMAGGPCRRARRRAPSATRPANENPLLGQGLSDGPPGRSRRRRRSH